ncbi:MAG: hypothetical protein AB7S65_12550 [Sulfuricurvum sp.]
MKTAKGEHKVEFFTNLSYIRQRYEAGAVVAKLLHKELFEAGKITMPYQSFAIYFRREIVGKTTPSTPKQETQSTDMKPVDTVQPVQAQKSKSETEHEPLWLTVGEKKKTGFNPHSRDIDPKDIL